MVEACYEWVDEEMKAEPGWPQYFGDIPLPPVIANVDTTAQLEMVVQDRSGLVHVFRLPADATSANLPWPEYGHDPCNTFNAETDRGLDRSPAHPGAELDGALQAAFSIGPSPLRQPVAWALFRVEHSGPVRLDVFDVQGRRIRTLVDESLSAGQYRIPWDGAATGGQPTSGVYFFRLTHSGHSEVRKISVVR